MKCTNCGNEIPNDAVFCSFCGASQANQTSSVDKTISSFNTNPIPNQQENKSQYSSPNPLPNQNQNQYGNNFVPDNDTKNKSNTALKIIIPIVAFVVAMIIGVAVLPNLLKSNSDDDDKEIRSSLVEGDTDDDSLEDWDFDINTEFSAPESTRKKSDEEIIEEYLEEIDMTSYYNDDLELSTEVWGNTVQFSFRFLFDIDEDEYEQAVEICKQHCSESADNYTTIKNGCPQIDSIVVNWYTSDDEYLYGQVY